MDSFFKIGDKVKCKEFERQPLTGKVVGFGVQMHRDTLHPVYLVELDDGFWSEDGGTYVSILVCHYENVEAWNG